MIVNPGVNASYLSEDEILRLEEGLGKIFTNPEIKCLLKYGVGGNYVEGVSDIDLLTLTKKTVTDKKALSEMGEQILDLYESFGKVAGFPKGADPDLSVYDMPTFSKHGFTAFDETFCELFEGSPVIAGKYPRGIKISKEADRGITHTAKNLSQLRVFPLLRGIILRFGGKEELDNIKQVDLIKIVDLPYAVFSYMKNKNPDSREVVMEYLESEFKKTSHDPLKALLETKKSLPNKIKFLDAGDDLLLEGITWYEQVISELLSLRPPS